MRFLRDIVSNIGVDGIPRTIQNALLRQQFYIARLSSDFSTFLSVSNAIGFCTACREKATYRNTLFYSQDRSSSALAVTTLCTKACLHERAQPKLFPVDTLQQRRDNSGTLNESFCFFFIVMKFQRHWLFPLPPPSLFS